jgi:hypothetical protein
LKKLLEEVEAEVVEERIVRNEEEELLDSETFQS